MSTSTPAAQPRAKASRLYAVSSISWLGWRSAGIAAVGLTAWRRAYDDSECPGPSSISTSGPSASTVLRQSEKRTVWRRWSTQYCGSVACSAVIHVPVRFDRYGTCGGDSSTCCTAARNSGRIGSSTELCPAAAIGISVGLISSVVTRSARAATSSAGPAMTHSSSALIVATDSVGGEQRTDLRLRAAARRASPPRSR